MKKQYITQNSILLRAVMNLVWVGLVMSFMIGEASLVWAWGEDDDRIPNGNVYSCNACHNPNNQFYADYRRAGRRWTTALSQMDSDGDGYTNGQELQDPNGTWTQGQPAPGNSSLVTNPGRASSHPNATATPTNPPATATPAPTYTPTPTNAPQDTATPTPDAPTPTPDPQNSPTPTPDSNYTATPTPEPGNAPHVLLSLSAWMFHAWDDFHLEATIQNPGDSVSIEFYVVLGIGGSYYFYPNWQQDLSYESIPLPAYQGIYRDILHFTWPENVGNMYPLYFYSAMLQPGTVNVIGNIETIEWGFE